MTGRYSLHCLKERILPRDWALHQQIGHGHTVEFTRHMRLLYQQVNAGRNKYLSWRFCKEQWVATEGIANGQQNLMT